jgi:hypothetical protein
MTIAIGDLMMSLFTPSTPLQVVSIKLRVVLSKMIFPTASQSMTIFQIFMTIQMMSMSLVAVLNVLLANH